MELIKRHWKPLRDAGNVVAAGWPGRYDVGIAGHRAHEGPTGADQTKTPVSSAVVFQRFQIGRFPEVGPEGFGNINLRVGNLPEQEVAHPQLAAGANQQIRVRHPARIEMLGNDFLVDVLRTDPFRLHLACDRTDGIDDLGATAVTQRQHQRQTSVFLQRVDGFGKLILRAGRQFTNPANRCESHIVLVQLLNLLLEVKLEQPH